jgi:large subunit ribosomal protein L30
MQQLKVTLVKSTIDRPKDQKATVIALGIRKMHHSVVVDANSAMVGMIQKVKHLVKVEQV